MIICVDNECTQPGCVRKRLLASVCTCGCVYEAHMWNINQQPEGEPEYETLGCRYCGYWDVTGDYVSGCSEFNEEEVNVC